MSARSIRESGPVVAPDRSLRLETWLDPGPVLWGATWAALCGAAAAWPDSAAGWPWVAAVSGSWVAAVPLFGASWAPAFGAEAAPRGVSVVAPGLRGRVATLLPLFGRLPSISPATGARLVPLVMALAVGALIGAAVTAAIAIGAALAATKRSRDPVGVRRTLLEVGVPLWAAWWAGGGPTPVPITEAVHASFPAAVVLWAGLNWRFLVLAGAFLMLHYAFTAVRGPGDLPRRHAQAIAAYLVAVGAVAFDGSGLTAGILAAFFVAAWPFLAAFREGKVRWHLQSAQGLAMAAMLVAFAL